MKSLIASWTPSTIAALPPRRSGMGRIDCYRGANMGRTAGVALLAVALSTLPSIPVWAQGAGGIAGVVKDASGAVLPGVTVEASSAALIERVRSVVTDLEGQYKIIDLRPGTHPV